MSLAAILAEQRRAAAAVIAEPGRGVRLWLADWIAEELAIMEEAMSETKTMPGVYRYDQDAHGIAVMYVDDAGEAFVGRIVEMDGKWFWRGDKWSYTAENLRQVADRIDELNGAKSGRDEKKPYVIVRWPWPQHGRRSLDWHVPLAEFSAADEFDDAELGQKIELELVELTDAEFKELCDE